jgi:hypothetical protein
LTTTPKYPIVVEPHIYQYDENVFVWFDEAGLVGGASNYLFEARKALVRYAESLDGRKIPESMKIYF